MPSIPLVPDEPEVPDEPSPPEAPAKFIHQVPEPPDVPVELVTVNEIAPVAELYEITVPSIKFVESKDIIIACAGVYASPVPIVRLRVAPILWGKGMF